MVWKTFLRLVLAAIGCGVLLAGVTAVRWRFGGTLDDFEGPFRPVEWSFNAGEEFEGASGAYVRSQKAARTGRYGGEIRFDFSQGGRYVQVLYPLRYRGPLTGLRFWVKGFAGHRLGLRVKDANDQVFQKELGLVPPRWEELRVAFNDWTESWGGPNDGVLKQPVRGIALVIVNSSPETRGSIWVDDVRRWDARLPQPPSRKRLPPHPRLLTSRAELDEARRRVRSEPWAREMLEEMERQCRAEVANGIAVPEKGGQCEHWYACPTHGASLRYEGPRRHVCPVDGQVFTGWPYDDVGVALEHKRLRRLVRNAAVIYALTGNPDWRDVTQRILMGYTIFYPSYPIHDIHGEPGKGGKAWAQSLDEAVWLIHLMQAADLVWDTFAEQGRQRFVRDLVTPAVEEVIRPARLRFHNIQCWHNAAVGLAGYLTGNRDWIAESVDGSRGFWAQLQNMVNQDGQWSEGSWGYHFYALEPLIILAEAAHHCGENLYSETVRSMFLAPLDAAMPDGTLPAFNDSNRLALSRYDLYETALRRLGDRRFSIPLHDREGWSFRALLHGVRPLPDVAGLRPQSRTMKDAGYAILTRGSGSNVAWVCVKYGPHGGDHGHPDKNNLVFYRNGRMVLDDPGIGAYLTPLADGWYKTTVAHNTVVRDLRSQHQTTGVLVAFSADEPMPMALTDARDALGSTRFRRAVYLLDHNTLVILDLLHETAGEASVKDIVWHPSGRWETALPGRPVPTEEALGYRYLRDLHETSGRRWSGQVKLGNDTVHIQMVTSSDVLFRAGTGVGAHTDDRVPVAFARLKATSAAVATVVSVHATKQPPAVTFQSIQGADGSEIPPGHAAVIDVITPGERWRLVANPDGRPLRFGTHSQAKRIVAERLD